MYTNDSKRITVFKTRILNLHNLPYCLCILTPKKPILVNNLITLKLIEPVL